MHNPNSIASTILMSGLRIFSQQWKWCDNPEEADLWGIDAKADDIEGIARTYRLCPDPKPKVIYLAESFTPMPVSHWVYFRIPIKISVLHKWLVSNHFVPDLTQDDKVLSEQGGTNPKWKTYRFKLKYWPNITQYAEGAEIMMVCSTMIHNWCEYNQLTPYGIDERILVKLLDDADKEGNLVYQSEPIPDGRPENYAENQKKSKSMGLGIFKRIFSRFRQ